MICNRIAVGLSDSSLSERLQLKANNTLERAVASAHQRESVKNQQKVVRAGGTLLTADALLLHGMKYKSVVSRPVSKQFHKMNPVTSTDICNRCVKHTCCTAKKHVFACMYFSSTCDVHLLDNIYNICVM